LSEAGEEIDMDLGLTDAKSHKFYKMQVLESNNNKKYWLIQHWGKIGSKGSN
jgi:predicted DNA-binding WGR domain protein